MITECEECVAGWAGPNCEICNVDCDDGEEEEDDGDGDYFHKLN